MNYKITDAMRRKSPFNQTISKLAESLYATHCSMVERYLELFAEIHHPRDMCLVHDPYAVGEPTYICDRDGKRLAKVWTEIKFGSCIQIKGEMLSEGLKRLVARV